MFSAAATSASSKGRSADSGKIPCVGISFGVERIYSILRAKEEENGRFLSGTGTEVDVYVMSVGDSLLEERMMVAKEFWDAQIRAQFMYKVKPKLRAQFDIVDRDHIPFAVILGPDEWKAGKVRIKQQKGKEENTGSDDAQGTLVDKSSMVAFVEERLKRSR